MKEYVYMSCSDHPINRPNIDIFIQKHINKKKKRIGIRFWALNLIKYSASKLYICLEMWQEYGLNPSLDINSVLEINFQQSYHICKDFTTEIYAESQKALGKLPIESSYLLSCWCQHPFTMKIKKHCHVTSGVLRSWSRVGKDLVLVPPTTTSGQQALIDQILIF